MYSEKELIELIKQLQESPQIVGQQIAEARKQVHDSIKAYFTHRLAETNGQITYEIKESADRLYDLPGTANALTDALNLEAGELRKLLGRKRVIKCTECGIEDVEVFELRKKGSYSQVEKWSFIPCQ